MPRFQPPYFAANLALLDQFRALACKTGCTPAQLSLGWVVARGDHVVAIPGTTVQAHMEENFATPPVIAPSILARVDVLFAPDAVAGARYPANLEADVDTEKFG